MVEASRWMTLSGALAAVEKYLVTLADHQLTLEMISEMIILHFAMDSVLARTIQLEGTGAPDRASFAADAARAYLCEAYWSLIWHAVQLTASIFEGPEMEARLAGLRRLASLSLPVNILSLKHRVADRVIEAGRYPL